VITLDGTPLANATVVFTPQEPGMKPSRGITDASGRYELTYLRDRKGAVLGKHEVRVTTRTEHKPTERVPAKYNSRSELTADVTSDGETFNFDLTSQ
jgi:hypothetical protein